MLAGPDANTRVHLAADAGSGTRCGLPLAGGMAIFPDIATAEALAYSVCEACVAAARAPATPEEHP